MKNRKHRISIISEKVRKIRSPGHIRKTRTKKGQNSENAQNSEYVQNLEDSQNSEHAQNSQKPKKLVVPNQSPPTPRGPRPWGQLETSLL